MSKLITPPELYSNNSLYPIFLKLEKLKILIVGGGKVALEKLNSLLGNFPEAKITLVAPEISTDIRKLTAENLNVSWIERTYYKELLLKSDIVIVAANNKELGAQIKQEANELNLLVNIADTPELCDFYLGSIVQKGNLKIGISTNGKSPTLAKRLKEALNEAIPLSINESLDNLETIRKRLNGNFNERITYLNKLTQSIVDDESFIEAQYQTEIAKNPPYKSWQLGAILAISTIALTILITSLKNLIL